MKQGKRENNERVPFVVPSKESATNGQIDALLSIVNCLTGRLNTQEPYSDGGVPTSSKVLDNGVKFALETSVIRALTVLDSVIDNEARWNVRRLVRMEHDAEKFLKANVEFLKEQAASAAHVRRPSFRFSPSLIRISDGTYAAVLGDLSQGHALVGQGRSPEDALLNFDAVFAGKTPEEMKEWLSKQDTTGTDTNEKQLDAGTTEPPAVSPPTGKDGDANRRGPRSGNPPGPKQDSPTRKRRHGPKPGKSPHG